MSKKPETQGMMIRVPSETFIKFHEINQVRGEDDVGALLSLIEAYVENHERSLKP